MTATSKNIVKDTLTRTLEATESQLAHEERSAAHHREELAKAELRAEQMRLDAAEIRKALEA
jgi:hypothetical protein